jgi:hypothetical protein
LLSAQLAGALAGFFFFLFKSSVFAAAATSCGGSGSIKGSLGVRHMTENRTAGFIRLSPEGWLLSSCSCCEHNTAQQRTWLVNNALLPQRHTQLIKPQHAPLCAKSAAALTQCV